MYLYIYDRYGIDGDTINSKKLLDRALSLYFKEKGKDMPRDLKVLRTPNGKPYIYPDINIYFSISHSNNIWGCIIGNRKVGLDIQWERSANIDKIARRYFPKPDAEYVQNHGLYGFFDIWTIKEALAKFMGSTIAVVMGRYPVSNGKEISKSLKIDGSIARADSIPWVDLIKDNKDIYAVDAEKFHMAYVAERKERIWIRKIN